MAALAAVHTAIRDQLSTIPGLAAFDHPPQAGTPPMAFVVCEEWEPTTMGRHLGQRQYGLTVYVFTAQSVRPLDGYRELMKYASATGEQSIEKAIYAGQHAAGSYRELTNTTVAVTGFRVLGRREVDTYEMYGGLFAVTVQTRE